MLLETGVIVLHSEDRPAADVSYHTSHGGSPSHVQQHSGTRWWDGITVDTVRNPSRVNDCPRRSFLADVPADSGYASHYSWNLRLRRSLKRWFILRVETAWSFAVLLFAAPVAQEHRALVVTWNGMLSEAFNQPFGSCVGMCPLLHIWNFL
jgi:hypothetical protein